MTKHWSKLPGPHGGLGEATAERFHGEPHGWGGNLGQGGAYGPVLHLVTNWRLYQLWKTPRVTGNWDTPDYLGFHDVMWMGSEDLNWDAHQRSSKYV